MSRAVDKSKWVSSDWKKRNDRKTERKIKRGKRRKLRDFTQSKNNNDNNNNKHHHNNGSDNDNNNNSDNNSKNNSDNNNDNNNKNSLPLLEFLKHWK